MSRPKDPTQTMMKQVKEQRQQAMNIAIKRKEEFLGARVPRELRQRVIDRANHLGIPVSILIRNVLEQAFDNAVQADAPFADVIGWEKVVLHRSVNCSGCGAELAKGGSAHFGMGARQQTVLCTTCLASQ